MTRAARTRERLQEAALGLFVARGFDDVTVEEVARAAGVSHMTFFRHFPTKESVVIDDPYDPLIGAAVARQDPTLPALERARRGVLDSWAHIDGIDEDAIRTRLVIAAGHPGLRSRIWENNHRTEQVIVEALTGTGVAPLEAQVAAGAVLGALTAALLQWATGNDSGRLGEHIRFALDRLRCDVDASP